MKNQDFEIRFKIGTKIEQIEQACIILYTIFGVFYQPDSVDQMESEILNDRVHVFGHIGLAFVDSIYANVSDFIEPDDEKEMTDDSTARLAVALSTILNNPKLPINFYNAIQNAIAEVYSGGDGEKLNSFESSPEFLKAVIDSCKQDEQ